MAITIEQLETNINELMKRARDPKTKKDEKKANLAEALAYWVELCRAKDGGEDKISLDDINIHFQSFLNGDALNSIYIKDTLDEYVNLPVETLYTRIEDLKNEIITYQGNVEGATAGANNIFSQMDRTWRVAKNSKEFDAAKKAMQDLSANKNPSQLDNYLATEPVKAYVQKNLKKAESAVGKTRMACALAFLKQTMSKESFQIYCNNLNVLRGIKNTITTDGMAFDKSEPRCIDPETIGTVGEVYKTFRDKFHDYAIGDKEIDPRDLATMTALKSLQAKGKDGEKLIVEHEALQAEIEKVQKDKRFQDALKTRSREELIEMAWGGNIDTLAGYAKPLNVEQQKRVDADKARIAKEKADREEAAKQKKQEEERKEQERIEKERKAEEDRKQKEDEEKRKEQEKIERRKNWRPLSDMLENLLPEFDKMREPLDSIFAQGFVGAEEEQNVEFFAKLVALGEVMRTNYESKDRQADPEVNLKEFNERVNTLKKEPLMKKMAKHVREHRQTIETIENLTEEAKTKGYDDKRDEKLYPITYFSAYAEKAYVREVKKEAEKKAKMDVYGQVEKEVLNEEKNVINNEGNNEAGKDNKKTVFTVADYYEQFNKEAMNVLDGKADHNMMKKYVAMAVALKEIEAKSGIDTPVDGKALNDRTEELYKTSDVESTVWALSGPTMSEKTQKTLAKTKDKGAAFIEIANNAYNKLVTEKQQRKNKAKEKTIIKK